MGRQPSKKSLHPSATKRKSKRVPKPKASKTTAQQPAKYEASVKKHFKVTTHSVHGVALQATAPFLGFINEDGEHDYDSDVDDDELNWVHEFLGLPNLSLTESEVAPDNRAAGETTTPIVDNALTGDEISQPNIGD